MSLLNNDSFAPASNKTAPTVAMGYEDHDINPIGLKPTDLSIDVQKFSNFSLRRKNKDKPAKKPQSKTPPDSPKLRSAETPGVVPPPPLGSRKGTGRGGGANTKGRKYYSTLMENKGSSSDEDIQDTFLLSKGHVAREKRSASGSAVTPTLHPSTTEGETRETEGSWNFPVRFTPPNEARFPESERNSNEFDFNISNIGLGGVSGPESHMTPAPSSGFAATTPIEQVPPFYSPMVPPREPSNEADWSISAELRQKCVQQFNGLNPVDNFLSGEKARDFFIQSKLPVEELSRIWKLSDIDRDGKLTQDEFIIAMKLVLMRRKKHEIPNTLPDPLKSVVKRQSIIISLPPPPPPQVKATPNDALVPDSAQPPPRPPPPSITRRTKTEPILDVPSSAGDVTTSSQIEHIIVDDKPYAVVTVTKKGDRHSSPVSGSEFIDQSNVSLIDNQTDTPLTTPSKPRPVEPMVAKLISLEQGDDSTGDEDEMTTLVGQVTTPTGNDSAPFAKPRRKKRSPQKEGGVKLPSGDIQRSYTVHGRPPPRPAPYQGPSPTHKGLPTAAKSSLATVKVPMDTQDRTGSPMSSEDQALIPLKVSDSSDNGNNKGHGRSTSWDLTKMLKEGLVPVHDDLPSAEPPKLPPRRNVGGPSSDDETSKPILPPALQRSASTGSIASTDTSALHNISIGKKSPSSESSGVGIAISSVDTQSDNLIPRVPPVIADPYRRPAPAPPPTKPKPPKKPMFPPSYKRINDKIDVEDDKSNPSMETYKKKTKTELQKTIKQLKEENDVYQRMNKELNSKLQELVEQRYRLEIRLESVKNH